MQDRTINNALRALCKAGGEQGDLAGRLLVMRGVDMPNPARDRPLQKGGCRRLMLDALRNGPQTTAELALVVQGAVPGISSRRAYHRAYMALYRLREAGLVGRDGRVWKLAP